jgi:hypothetical protein
VRRAQTRADTGGLEAALSREKLLYLFLRGGNLVRWNRGRGPKGRPSSESSDDRIPVTYDPTTPDCSLFARGDSVRAFADLTSRTRTSLGPAPDPAGCTSRTMTRIGAAWSYSGFSSPPQTAQFDNVSIGVSSLEAALEPGIMLLMGVGSVGVALTLRRRAASRPAKPPTPTNT